MAMALSPVPAPQFSAAERDFLLRLQSDALRYFIDNQAPSGLILDRQANFGRLRPSGLCSTSATGMGLIALALASADPHRLLTHGEAVARVGHALRTALERLPHTDGILPHFIDESSGAVAGFDARSTIDTAWFVAGALWAAAFLRDDELARQADRFYERIDWRAWTAHNTLLHHGAYRDGRKIPCCWDRLNGETIFLYVLAAGAREEAAWPAAGWSALRLFRGELAGLNFASADLGLFASQYGFDLLDLRNWLLPDGVDLRYDAGLAAQANAHVCRQAADRFTTYRHLWGISAGDGPGTSTDGPDPYRCFSPAEPLDGTAHITTTIASLEHRPQLVWQNLEVADHLHGPSARGRYGFSNVNLDRDWVSKDMVGIDLGAAVLALSNILMTDQVRTVFHSVPAVQRGIQRLGWLPAHAEVRSTRAAA
jgi:hypothetical protein